MKPKKNQHKKTQKPEDVLTVETLTKKDWQQIRLEAVKVKASGQFGNDELKCAVLGFVNWVMEQDILVAAGVEALRDGEVVH